MAESITKYKVCGIIIDISNITSIYNIMDFVFSNLEDELYISNIKRKLDRIVQFANLYNEQGGNIAMDDYIDDIKKFDVISGLLIKYFGDYKINIMKERYIKLNLFDIESNHDIYEYVVCYKYNDEEVGIYEVLDIINNVNEFSREYRQITGLQVEEGYFENYVSKSIIPVFSKFINDVKFKLSSNMLSFIISKCIAQKALQYVKEDNVDKQIQLIEVMEQFKTLDIHISYSFLRTFIMEEPEISEVFRNYKSSYFAYHSEEWYF